MSDISLSSRIGLKTIQKVFQGRKKQLKKFNAKKPNLEKSEEVRKFKLKKRNLKSVPEKYREHGSAAPRKGHFCQEGRCHFKGKQYIIDVKSLILLTFN